MLPSSQAISSLLYIGLTYPVISFCFGSGIKNRKTALFLSLSIIISALAVKLYFEAQDLEPNYYTILESSRSNSPFEIRQAYKRVSLKYHPDKNPSADAEEIFQTVKVAYDVLMDETKRDIYNRFGPEALQFDPRSDELKLLISLGIMYVYWGVIMYVATLPKAARACRTWVLLVLVAMLLGEVFLCLTETVLPKWMPSTLTEHEFAAILHALFPGILMVLRCISEYLYIDIDKCSVDVLIELSKHQKAMQGLLHQLQVLVTVEERTKEMAPVEDIKAKIDELKEVMKESTEASANVVAVLKDATANPGSNYYWLIFSGSLCKNCRNEAIGCRTAFNNTFTVLFPELVNIQLRVLNVLRPLVCFGRLEAVIILLQNLIQLEQQKSVYSMGSSRLPDSASNGESKYKSSIGFSFVRDILWSRDPESLSNYNVKLNHK
eukprot:gene9885-20570_t